MNRFIVILGIAVMATTASSLKCYVCEGTEKEIVEGTSCLTDPDDRGTLMECAENDTFCITLDETLSGVKPTPVAYTARSCQGPIDMKNGECKDCPHKHQFGTTCTVCVCNGKDGCNGAPLSVQASISVLLVICAFRLMTTKLF